MFYTIYPACDVIEINLIIKQDGGRLVSIVLQYFKNKACYKKLTMQITIANLKGNILPYPFNCSFVS